MKFWNKRTGFRSVIAAAGLAVAMSISVPADATGPLYGSTYASKVTNKFGRGLGNVLFCWVEFPIEWNEEIQNTDLVTGVIIGTGEGFWYTIRRFGLGVADVVTFPIDVYGNNYQSIQRSEFPFLDEVE